MIKKIRLVCAGVVVLGVLTACGGGGGGGGGNPAPMASAEGVYKATVTNSPNVSVLNAIVLEDGQFWGIYGNDVGGGLVVNGLVQGQGTSNNGAFTSSTIKDFGVVPAAPATLNATYVPGGSISGSFVEGNSTFTISGAVVPTTSFDYNSPASLSNIVGNWNLSSTSGNQIPITIAINGTFTGIAVTGCSVSGTVTPRPSGKNVFNVQWTNGASPCSLPGLAGAGIGIYTTPANGTHQLLVAVIDSSRTYGSVAFGTR